MMNQKKKTKVKRKLFGVRKQAPCVFCEKFLTFAQATLDHVIPKSCGGGNEFENFRLACFTCNNRRRSMDYWAFMKIVKAEIEAKRKGEAS